MTVLTSVLRLVGAIQAVSLPVTQPAGGDTDLLVPAGKGIRGTSQRGCKEYNPRLNTASIGHFPTVLNQVAIKYMLATCIMCIRLIKNFNKSELRFMAAFHYEIRDWTYVGQQVKNTLLDLWG